MRIIYNRVTWYSKLLAMLLFASLPFIGFYFGVQYQKSQSPPLDLSSGIMGHVLIGPQCPVQIMGEGSCDDKPYQTQIEIFEKENSGKSLKTISTNSEGYFKAELLPGIYILRVRGGNPFPACGEQEVEVEAYQFRDSTLYCDKGIR